MVLRKRLDLKGEALVFVTTTVVEWKSILDKPIVSKIIIEEYIKTMELYNVKMIGYVIMPSHIHTLLSFKEIEVLSKFMQCFKSITSRKIKKLKLIELEGLNNIWKPRFDDLIITTEKQYKIKLEYIHNNPIKDSLAKNLEDWVLSSAKDWYSDVKGPIPIDKSWF